MFGGCPICWAQKKQLNLVPRNFRGEHAFRSSEAMVHQAQSVWRLGDFQAMMSMKVKVLVACVHATFQDWLIGVFEPAPSRKAQGELYPTLPYFTNFAHVVILMFLTVLFFFSPGFVHSISCEMTRCGDPVVVFVRENSQKMRSRRCFSVTLGCKSLIQQCATWKIASFYSADRLWILWHTLIVFHSCFGLQALQAFQEGIP